MQFQNIMLFINHSPPNRGKTSIECGFLMCESARVALYIPMVLTLGYPSVHLPNASPSTVTSDPHSLLILKSFSFDADRAFANAPYHHLFFCRLSSPPPPSCIHNNCLSTSFSPCVPSWIIYTVLVGYIFVCQRPSPKVFYT